MLDLKPGQKSVEINKGMILKAIIRTADRFQILL